MAYELPPSNITNSSEALVDLVVYISSEVPILAPSILFLIFIVLLGSGYFSEERRKGRGDLAKWFAISGFITATLSIVLFLINGIVNLVTVVIAVVVSMIGTLWLLFTSRD